jgi:hypothetical protein
MLNNDQPRLNRSSLGRLQSPSFLHRSCSCFPSPLLLTLNTQARFFGSPYHTINPFKAAIAAVHLVLVPLFFISNDKPNNPVRYGARTDWWGREYVDTSPVKEWVSNQVESAALVEKFDVLYSETKKARTSTEA